MNYILTETNPHHGTKGLIINRDQYIKCPYNDRALYELVCNEADYDYKLTVERLGKEPVHYLSLHALQLEELIKALKIKVEIFDMVYDLKRDCTLTINQPEAKYIFRILYTWPRNEPHRI